MSIKSLFSKERDRYVEFFVKARDKIATSTPTAANELLISINNDAIAYPYRYLRVDVMAKSDDGSPKPYEVRIDSDLLFEAKRFNFGAFQVEVHSFTWNAVQILFNRAISNTEQLERWITRWLDVEDKQRDNLSGLSLAIHSFTPLEHFGEWWYLTGDFGTAPSDALIELIELLAGQGMARIIIKGVAGST